MCWVRHKPQWAGWVTRSTNLQGWGITVSRNRPPHVPASSTAGLLFAPFPLLRVTMSYLSRFTVGSAVVLTPTSRTSVSLVLWLAIWKFSWSAYQVSCPFSVRYLFPIVSQAFFTYEGHKPLSAELGWSSLSQNTDCLLTSLVVFLDDQFLLLAYTLSVFLSTVSACCVQIFPTAWSSKDSLLLDFPRGFWLLPLGFHTDNYDPLGADFLHTAWGRDQGKFSSPWVAKAHRNVYWKGFFPHCSEVLPGNSLGACVHGFVSCSPPCPTGPIASIVPCSLNYCSLKSPN